jgi:formylglycine-generating enzyme required for sulfatase activity
MPDFASRSLKVFLCHTSADKPTVRELYRQLDAEGWIDAWLDEIKLLPGQEWDMEIERAVEDADVVIVCISTRSVDKEGYVQKEIRYVLNIADEKPEGSIFVIPLKLDDCVVPRRLRAWQWVNYYPETEKSVAYQRLLQSLRLRAARLGISSITPGKSLHYMTREEFVAASDVAIPDKLEPVETPTTKEEEKIVENKRLDQTRHTLEKRRVLLNPKLRLFIGVAGVLILIPLFIMLAVNYSINNLFQLVTVTSSSTNAISTTPISQPKTPDTLSPTETPIAPTRPPILIGEDGMTLVYVPAGEFTMGSDNSDSDEKPAHTVTLDSYWIDQTEVTNKMYARCVSAGVCKEPAYKKSSTRSSYYDNSQYNNYPVIYVDWNMAKTYCEWMARRLPTEAEWEKAARGTDGRSYPWGFNLPTDDLLNYNDALKDTTEVGKYPEGKSYYGALDMAGNVMEWVSSLYKPYPYSAIDGREDLSASGDRVLRGGSWAHINSGVRSFVRYSEFHSFSDDDVGFRCAMIATP